MRRITVLLILSAACLVAQPRNIDPAKSTMTVFVHKAGALSAFGHNHEIAAPIRSGTADVTAHRVELTVEAASMKVIDPGESEKDRTEVQASMTGPGILDAAKYREIVFRSTTVAPAGQGGWTVNGTLALHGETKPVVVSVVEKGGRYTGTAQLRLSDFGIKPESKFGGAVKVKDEIRIQFDIQLEGR